MEDEIERVVELFGGNKSLLKEKLRQIFIKHNVPAIETIVIEEAIDLAIDKHYNLK